MPDGASNPVAARWLRGDVLVVWGTDGAGTQVDTFTEDTTVTPPKITQMTLVGTNRELGSGAEAALITNCEQSHLFDIEDSDGASLTIGAGTGQALSGNYKIDYDAAVTFGQQPMNKAAVYAFGYEAYFVCCTDSDDGSLITDDPQQCTGTSDRYIPALCRWRAGGTTQALISGVADMRITYSGDTDGDQVIDFRASDGDTVHSAAWVTEQELWPKVVGAQIELLVLSVELDPLARTNVAASELTRGVGLFSDVETKAPINLRWPPNNPDTPPNSPAEDTLGYTLRNLTDNRRLFERFVISAAFRARAPWYIEE